jgi:hypothetical protein
MIVNKSTLSQILFLDIETVPAYASFDELPDELKPLWTKKASYLNSNETSVEESYSDKAGIYSEFAKVICISVGFVSMENYKPSALRIKSFYGDDEKEVLSQFSELIKKYYNDPEIHFFCGHNIKEFDIPFICRRLLINGLEIPSTIQVSGKKPWECKHLIDSLELWKFGDYKNYTSLNLLAAVLGIPSPKDDIDGSMVRNVYYEDNDIKRIVSYCEKDVVTVVQVVLKMAYCDLIVDENITSATFED